MPGVFSLTKFVYFSIELTLLIFALNMPNVFAVQNDILLIQR